MKITTIGSLTVNNSEFNVNVWELDNAVVSVRLVSKNQFAAIEGGELEVEEGHDYYVAEKKYIDVAVKINAQSNEKYIEMAQKVADYENSDDLSKFFN